jgi:hypothetical protein
VSLFGVPVSTSIDIEDSEAVQRAIRATPPKQPLPHEVYDLLDLYPQAGEGRPSVIYVPLKRPAAAGASGTDVLR